MSRRDGADVIVVGAGLAGCALAWHLDTADVLLVEQGSQPGAEATAQNAGMVRRLGLEPEERALSRRTFDFLCAPGEGWPDGQVSRRVGAILATAYDPLLLHDAVLHARGAGAAIEACDRPAEVAPAMVDARVRGAWYLPDERVADPHALLTGYLRAMRQRGGQVRCGVRVTGLAVIGGEVRGVTTDHGPLFARQVVMAGGAWCAGLAAAAGLRRPLIALRRTLLHSAPHPLARPDHPWCWIEDAGIYIRHEAGGWLASPCDEAVDLPRPGPGSRGAPGELARALVADRVSRLLPALSDARWSGGWTGLRTFAPDRRPMLGADPEVAGLWWIAGLGGFGVTCGHAAGEAVASWMTGRDTPWMHKEGVAPGRHHLGRWPIRTRGDLDSSRLIDTDAALPGWSPSA